MTNNDLYFVPLKYFHRQSAQIYFILTSLSAAGGGWYAYAFISAPYIGRGDARCDKNPPALSFFLFEMIKIVLPLQPTAGCYLTSTPFLPMEVACNASLKYVLSMDNPRHASIWS